MASFAAAGHVTQSLDGSVLTFFDDSPYGANDQGLNLVDFASRIVTVADYNGNTLGNIDLGASALSGTFPITADGEYRFTLTLVPVVTPPANYQATVNYLAARYYLNQQKNYTAKIVCGSCCSAKAQEYANKALQCYFSAADNLLVGDYVACQNDITTANKYIAAALKY